MKSAEYDRTIDDCYTPPEIYDVVCEFVEKKYGVMLFLRYESSILGDFPCSKGETYKCQSLTFRLLSLQGCSS